MAGTVHPAIALSSLLLFGSLPTPVASAQPAPKASLKSAAGSLLVVAVYGEAQTAGRQIRAGATLAAGDELRTGQDGHVRLKLADDSTLTLQASGRVAIDRYRVLPAAKGTDTSLRLDHGRIEATIRGPRHGDTRFEVRTPVAVALTRGALFRITADPSQRSATCETAEGSVLISASGNAGSVEITGGLGTRVVAGSLPIRPRALLAGPRLWTGIQLVEQRPVEIPFSPLNGTVLYRVIITPGDDLFRHLVEEVVPVPRLRIAALADGDYFVRVRAIDQNGLEGVGTIARMTVRARADPPSLAQPPDRGRLHGKTAALAWLPDSGAVSYVVQLAENSVFRSQLREWSDLRTPGLVATDLRPGSYHWRVASVLKDGSQSRFSAPRSFLLNPAPRPPSPPKVEDEVLHFTWVGLPGQIFVLQLAADPRFEHVVEERRTNRPGADLPRPLPGAYYARLRTTDLDGSIGPFTDAIKIEISGRTPRPGCLVEGERGLCAVYAAEPSPLR